MSIPPRNPVPAGDTAPSDRSWTVDQLRQVLNGSADTSTLKAVDRNGMRAGEFALLQTAAATEELRPLLTLLDPPGAEVEASVEQILSLLEAIALSQARTEARLAALERAIVGHFDTSPRRQDSGDTGSPR